MSNRKYAIVGTGGIGGYYGAKLQKAGFDVHFLLHSDYEKVKTDGLKVESVEGDILLPKVNAYNNPSAMPECDVVIVALKSTSNTALENILPKVISPQSVILLMQNGIGCETEVASFAGTDNIIGGLCFICSSKVGPGHIKHVDYGSVNIASYKADGTPAGITDQMRSIYDDFTAASINIRMSEDILDARWRKLVWNVPFNGLSVLLNTATDKLLKNDYSRKLVKDLMYEVQSGAASQGKKISDDFIEKMIANTEKMTPYKPSMKLDYESKRPMEVESIYGNTYRIALDNGIVLPKIKVIYEMLKFLDQQNK